MSGLSGSEALLHFMANATNNVQKTLWSTPNGKRSVNHRKYIEKQLLSKGTNYNSAKTIRDRQPWKTTTGTKQFHADTLPLSNKSISLKESLHDSEYLNAQFHSRTTHDRVAMSSVSPKGSGMDNEALHMPHELNPKASRNIFDAILNQSERRDKLPENVEEGQANKEPKESSKHENCTEENLRIKEANFVTKEQEDGMELDTLEYLELFLSSVSSEDHKPLHELSSEDAFTNNLERSDKANSNFDSEISPSFGLPPTGIPSQASGLVTSYPTITCCEDNGECSHEEDEALRLASQADDQDNISPLPNLLFSFFLNRSFTLVDCIPNILDELVWNDQDLLNTHGDYLLSPSLDISHNESSYDSRIFLETVPCMEVSTVADFEESWLDIFSRTDKKFSKNKTPLTETTLGLESALPSFSSTFLRT